MADAGPPQAADTPNASPQVGPDPLDADALRNLQRLLDDGEIDADEFERRKEALGLEETNVDGSALAAAGGYATKRAQLPRLETRPASKTLPPKREGDAAHGVRFA